MGLERLGTPAALIDVGRMQHNIARMQQRMDAMGVRFRPHVKTTKCLDIVRAQLAAGACGITVSTLKEAEEFSAAGIGDILYAVGMAPSKLASALALRRRGCALKLLTDNADSARAIAAFCRAERERLDVLLEIDTDGHRSGLKPDDDLLLDVAAALADGAHVAGVMTHAGASYELDTPEALQAMAEQERAGCVRAAERLRAAGHSSPIVSVGSTPTALSARALDGVTEVRAGVYVFFDLVMRNVGVCTTDDIALSVLTTVIGHQAERGWTLVDAGWMAMSRDRGTRDQASDFGYGQVCAEDGTPITGYLMTGANQEHGIVSRTHGGAGETTDVRARFPVGTLLRILPNHACATGAQFGAYQALSSDGAVSTWPRFSGW